MKLNELRSVCAVKKLYLYNAKKKEAQEVEEYSSFKIMCKYGENEVMDIRADLEVSGKSGIDNSISLKPIVVAIVKVED